MHVRVLSAGLAVALTACGVASEGTGAEPAETTTAGDPDTATTDRNTTTSEAEMDDESAVVEKASQDLAARLEVPESDIELISVEKVTWSDGSLGCAEPGQSYTQALVEGGRIVLGHDETVYLYHYGGDREPFLCQNPETKDGGYDFVPPPGDDTR